MDFIDESEDNPLLHKNLELRARVEAINAATRKALPSIETMTLENDECDDCLTREQIISKYYLRSRETFTPLLEVHQKNPTSKNEGIKIDSDIGNSMNSTKEQFSFELLSEGRASELILHEQEILPEESVKISRHTEGTRKCPTVVGECDCVAAQGDGSQCGPSRNELLMAELIKRVGVSCGEYLNPITGETVYPEEGDMKSTQSSHHVCSSSGKSKKEKLNVNKVLVEKPDNQYKCIDLRVQSKEYSTTIVRDKKKNSGIYPFHSSVPFTFHKDKDYVNIVSDEEEEEEGACFLSSEAASSDEIPRACFANSSPDSRVLSLQSSDLCDQLSTTIFKIKSPVSSCEYETLSQRDNLDFSNTPEGYIPAPYADEIIDTVDRVWNWVTTIPRSCYLENYLSECVAGSSVANNLDERLLTENFKSCYNFNSAPEFHSSANQTEETCRFSNVHSQISEEHVTFDVEACTDSPSKNTQNCRDPLNPYNVGSKTSFDFMDSSISEDFDRSSINESLKFDVKSLI